MGQFGLRVKSGLRQLSPVFRPNLLPLSWRLRPCPRSWTRSMLTLPLLDAQLRVDNSRFTLHCFALMQSRFFWWTRHRSVYRRDLPCWEFLQGLLENVLSRFSFPLSCVL